MLLTHIFFVFNFLKIGLHQFVKKFAAKCPAKGSNVIKKTFCFAELACCGIEAAELKFHLLRIERVGGNFKSLLRAFNAC